MRENAQRGISLIELSVVITVTGIIISGMLALTTLNKDRRKHEITIARMNAISNALTVFLGMNGRLPCPASPSQLNSNDTFGMEQVTAGSSGNPQVCNTTSSNINIFSGSIATGETQYMGAPPITSLSLPDEMMYDGWGNRFAYAVQEIFVNNNTTNTSCSSNSGTGPTGTQNSFSASAECFSAHASGYTVYKLRGSSSNITIVNANLNVVSYSPVYVLISYGPNGYGAFTMNADVDLDHGGADGPNTNRNATPPVSNTYELYNTNCSPSTGTCSSSGLTQQYVQNDPISGFDDIVMFKDRNGMLLDCNKYGKGICTAGGILIG